MRALKSRTIVIVASLGLLLVIGVGLRGAPRLSGVRWVPQWNPPANTVPTMAPLPPQATAGPVPPPRSALPSVPVTLLWALLAVAITVAVLLLLRWWLRRRRRAEATLSAAELSEPELSEPPEPAAEPEPDAPTLRRGFDQALFILGKEAEPRDAIVKAWLGLQDAAEESGIHRGIAETPTEFTSRILGRVATDAGAVRTLLRLYLRVRFGEHPVTGDDIASARHSLESLAASWKDDRILDGGRR